MGRDEALALADQVLSELRKLSYDECRQLMSTASTRVLNGRDGKEYQLGIEAFWDARTSGNIRVLVTVSGGRLSDFKPWCRDFIIAPDGSYLGEG